MIRVTHETHEDTYTAVNYDIIQNGTTVGYASVMANDNGAYCERIDIDPEYQRRGYGTAALLELSAVYGGIIVAPDNEDARRLYERIGTEANGVNTDIYDQGYGVYKI